MIPRTRLLLAIGSMLLAVLALGAAPASGQLALEAQWGSPGSGDGQFAVPIDVAGDGAGHVYVVDPVLGRVEKFDSNGNFITAWSGPASPDGQSFQPFGVAVDRGTVYVSDLASDGVYKFDPSGNLLGHFGSPGSGPGQFLFPVGLATAANGDVYVSDTLNTRVQELTPSGAFVRQWGGFGYGDGQFVSPWDLNTDAAGNVYVADRIGRVEKFSPSGAFLASFGDATNLEQPFGVAVDNGGNVYVADTLGNRIQEFRSGGAPVGEVVGEGSGPGEVSFPVGIDLDRASASLYVADAGNARIEKFHLPVPVLTVPGDLTVNATSPAGAVVSYTATATDQTDPSPVVACSPPSGSTFAIGDSAVGCTATNDSGGTAQASFDVHVKDAGAQLGDLLAKLKGYGLTPKGAEQSLVVKLDAALARLATADNSGACSALQSFLAEVAAQRGKKLTVAQADSLTADARRIRSVLGC